MSRAVAVAAAALALILLPATAALAAYRATASASGTVSTDTVAPPTGLTNGSTCNFLVQTVSVSWTASTTTRTTGYAVSITVNGATTSYLTTGTSYSRSMLLGAGKVYTVAVRTELGSWTSVTAPSVTFTC